MTSAQAASCLKLGETLLNNVKNIQNLANPADAGEAISRCRTQLDEQASSVPSSYKNQIEQSLQESVKTYMQFKKNHAKKLEASAIATIEAAIEKSLPAVVCQVDLDAKSLKVFFLN